MGRFAHTLSHNSQQPKWTASKIIFAKFSKTNIFMPSQTCLISERFVYSWWALPNQTSHCLALKKSRHMKTTKDIVKGMFPFQLREGSKKKTYFLWSYTIPRGRGGSVRVLKKPYWFFEEEKKLFFQRAFRIILGPPNRVLHLIWSVCVIYTAIRTALKEAWKARILGKERSESKNKKKLEWDQM